MLDHAPRRTKRATFTAFGASLRKAPYRPATKELVAYLNATTFLTPCWVSCASERARCISLHDTFCKYHSTVQRVIVVSAGAHCDDSRFEPECHPEFPTWCCFPYVCSTFHFLDSKTWMTHVFFETIKCSFDGDLLRRGQRLVVLVELFSEIDFRQFQESRSSTDSRRRIRPALISSSACCSFSCHSSDQNHAWSAGIATCGLKTISPLRTETSTCAPG